MNTKNVVGNKRFFAAFLSVLAIAAGCFAFSPGGAQAALSGVSVGRNFANYPLWYEDVAGTGSRLQQCLGSNPDGSGLKDPNCVLLADPGYNPALSLAFPTNFPIEAFYSVADATMDVGALKNKAKIRVALEGAFPISPVPGQQTTFIRINMSRLNNLAPNSSYRVDQPFGSFVITTDALGSATSASAQGGQVVYRAQDLITPVAISALDPGAYSLLLPAASTNVSKFLRWTTGAPLGYLGDGATLHAITGGTNPAGNVFKITALSGPALLTDLDPLTVGLQTTVQTDQWTLAGKLYPSKVGFNTQPSATATQGTALTVQPIVALQDNASGVTIPSANNSVTLAAFTDPACTIAPATNPLVGTATVAAINGTATFTGLSFNTGGTFYLQATSPTMKSACSSAIIVKGAQVFTSIAVTPATVSLLTGATAQLTASARDQVGVAMTTQPAMTWTSSAPAIATVSASGVVTAVSAGTANITAKDTATGLIVSNASVVTVTAPPVGQVLPVLTTMTALPATIPNFFVGNTRQMIVNGFDQNSLAITPAPAVTWASSDPTVATISATGMITAVAPGPFTVTATSVSNPLVKASVTSAVVTPVVANSINISPSPASVAVGITLQLSGIPVDQFGAPITPLPTINSWTSSNNAVATVDSKGLVKGVSTGSVTITATSGSITGTVTVNVIARSATPAIKSIIVGPNGLTVRTTNTQQFTAQALDQNGINLSSQPTFTWSSSNAAVGTVDNTGKFTAKTAGMTIIKATSGVVSGQTLVSVIANPGAGYVLNKIVQFPENLTLINQDTEQFTATEIDQEGAATGEALTGATWESSDTSVGTINSSGVFTAKAPGTTNITVSGEGVASETTTVTVLAKPTTIAGITDGQAMNADVNPVVTDATNMTLDGAPFVSGTTVAAEGKHTLVTTDAGGNTSTVNFTIDKTAPVISGVENNNSYNKDKTPTITDNLGGVTATLDGKAFASGAKVSAEGMHTLVATDAAGNGAAVIFEIDKTAPAIAGVLDKATVGDNVTITFDKGDATVDGVPFASGSQVTGEGIHTLMVTDAAGNMKVASFRITKDVAINNKALSSITKKTATVSWTTPSNTVGRVLIGTNKKNLKTAVVEIAATSGHALVIKNLQNNKTYFYKIVATRKDTGKRAETKVAKFTTKK